MEDNNYITLDSNEDSFTRILCDKNDDYGYGNNTVIHTGTGFAFYNLEEDFFHFSIRDTGIVSSGSILGHDDLTIIGDSILYETVGSEEYMSGFTGYG